MESGPISEQEQWRVGEIDHNPDGDVSLEILIEYYQNRTQNGSYRFQYYRWEDGAGPIYRPGRKGSSFEGKDAARDNRAAFEAAQAVAEETGTRAEIVVFSQAYLNQVSRESLSELIGEVGEKQVRELLVDKLEE